MVRFYFEEINEDNDLDVVKIDMKKGFVGDTSFDEYSELYLEFMKSIGYTCADNHVVIDQEEIDKLIETNKNSKKIIDILLKEMSQLKSDLEEQKDYDENDEETNEELEDELNDFPIFDDESDEYSYIEEEEEP